MIRIYNTLSAEKEELAPQDNTVKMYVCGVTPYAPAHVGHAMSYILFDTVRRYLEHRGYGVQHVQNFTDIDDKIIDRAARLGIDPRELADRHIGDFFEEMDDLNIKRADLYPRATEELPKIIEVIQGLVDQDYAYAAQGDVYFRVRRDEDYGKLSHRTLDNMISGTRIEHGEKKQDPLDFALWKGAKEGEPSWPSPWGPGRPGWHIECSAMALRHLGDTIDIHGGGQDLVFPHHENEIAQSESFSGASPFVRIWMHNGLLQLGEEKMSKSVGNLVTVREALDKYSADALRLFVLSSYYRSPLTFTNEAVKAAERGAERLRNALTVSGSEGDVLDAEPYRQRLGKAMDDDFNTPQAIAALFDLARSINRAAGDGQSVGAAQSALRELAHIMGLTLAEPETGGGDAGPFIELLIETRADLRKAKRFELADGIREGLQSLGIALEDGAEGTRWRRGV